MRFSPKLDRDLVAQLKDKEVVAPREVVGALLSYGKPDQVITYRVDAAEGETQWGWRCLARSAGGLLIVWGFSEGSRWSWAERWADQDRKADVQALWFPLSKIRSVGVREASAWASQMSSDMDDVVVEGTWVIQVDGYDDPIVLDRPPTNQDFEVVESFCVALVKEVAACA